MSKYAIGKWQSHQGVNEGPEERNSLNLPVWNVGWERKQLLDGRVEQ
jgi:hypothetical protein